MRKAEDQIRCFMWNRSKRTYTTGVLGGFTGTRGLVPIGKVIFLDLGVACDTVERKASQSSCCIRCFVEGVCG
jgi:hypothetical protein